MRLCLISRRELGTATLWTFIGDSREFWPDETADMKRPRNMDIMVMYNV